GADRLVPSVYPTIQAGIDAAGPGDAVIIAEGIYTDANNRDLDFGGKAITVRSTDPNNPAVVAATVIDCQSSARGFYFHSGETASSVLAGLTISNGYADNGGGVRCEGSSPTIRKCVFSGNAAESDGGGIGNEGCSPTVTGCVFTGNSAANSSGGGICNYNCSSLIVTNCVFTGNTAYWGGGIENWESSTIVTNCIFAGNTATVGGGIGNWEGSPTIVNCTFNGNSADYGGGIESFGDSNPDVSNCILWGDSALDGPEIYGDCSISYSDVEGGYAGAGNIDADPCFVDAVGGDYHLQEGSPCIDAGTNSPTGGLPETDIEGIARPVDGDLDYVALADMGAYEFAFAEPVIGLSATEFEFTADLDGANPADQILSVWNGGAGTLNWVISYDCDWLSVEPNSGSSTGEVNEVTLSVDISGLAAGSYYCELTISDPCALNSPRTVDISLTIIGPIIELSSQQFQFTANLGGPNPEEQILSVSNSGGGTLNWTTSNDCNWLSVEPNSGSSTGELNLVTLSVDISGLGGGSHSCELIISDPNAENTPQMVAIDLTVYPPWDHNGLISWWQFEEGGGTTAYDSFGGNDGTIYGANWTSGMIRGSALDFDGVSDYVDCGNDDSLKIDVSNGISLAAWICPRSLGLRRIISSPRSFGWSRYVLGGWHNGKIAAEFVIYDVHETQDVVITQDTWKHIVATYDGSVIQIFVNGEEQNVEDVGSGTGFGWAGSTVWIGGRQGSSQSFNGKIDDVQIYDRVLSAGQIQQLYREGTGKKAFDPDPADGATTVEPDVILSWSPGIYQASHDIYFGTSFADVNDATSSSAAYMGRQDVKSWDSNNYDSN
ncbi:MAG: LamG-like jellyroll fold domain-containing protein, partial [Planctomycetota bacterium]